MSEKNRKSFTSQHKAKVALEAIRGTKTLNEIAQDFAVLLERLPDNPKVTVTVGKEDEKAVVTISDNAGGIPEEIIHKIFDPYFTTKGPQAGTGVGLFMSKTIKEKNMGGRLTVHNTVEGAEFRIEV